MKLQNGNSGSGGEGKRRGGKRLMSWVPRRRSHRSSAHAL